MKQYHDLLRDIIAEGTRSDNRTGIDTIKLDGAMIRFDMSDGTFPAVTTKRLFFKSVVGELCAFLRASRSAADFRALGCKVWDANANDPGLPGSPNEWLTNPFRQGEDELGPIYGVQWREWPGFKQLYRNTPNYGKIRQTLISDGWKWIASNTDYEDTDNEADVFYKEIDQLGDCLRKIIKSPNNRRILFHGWNPAVLDEVALPACHLLYQFLPNVTTGKLNMTLLCRSWDVHTGAPFNIAEAAVLLHLMAKLTGYKVGRLTIFASDVHIYVHQLDHLEEQLTKEPLPLPMLKISDRVPFYDAINNEDFLDPTGDTQIAHLVEWLKLVEPSDFELVNYQYHTLATASPKMAV